MEINLYGPPGSGKTRTLIGLFVQAVKTVGDPSRAGAVTFTRAAADELRVRAATALGLQGSPYTLRRAMPWVGTIHSLCFRLLGVHRDQMVDLRQFARDVGTDPPRLEWSNPSAFVEFDTQFPEIPNFDATDVELMAVIWASARHRLVSLDTILETQEYPGAQFAHVDADRIRWLVKEYNDWKRMHDFWDFEDLLDEGCHLNLPIRALVADEVQDNSPLLWQVLEAWEAAPRLATVIHAGDPYQAIYSFAGADPHLFNQRKGVWRTVGDSHRFNQATAEYAGRVIRDAYADTDGLGIVNERLTSWRGVGGEPVDDSHFYLARTHKLLTGIREHLIDNARPFRQLRGRAPLQTRAADAYRSIIRMRQGEQITDKELKNIAEQCPPGTLSRGVRTAVKDLPSQQLGQEIAEKILGKPLKKIQDGLPYADYLRAIFVGHGVSGLFLTPKVAIGTIHSAKGKEADHVTLVRSWGKLPALALNSQRGRIEEGCVAYVAASRHRVDLNIVNDMGDGVPYPWPEPTS